MSTIPLQGIVAGDTVTRIRTEAGSYVDGLYVKGAETSTEIKASVQIYDRFFKDAKNLSEGVRLKDWIEVYSPPNSFRSASDFDNLVADKIVYNGATYEVKQAHPWRGAFLTHDRVFAERLD